MHPKDAHPVMSTSDADSIRIARALGEMLGLVSRRVSAGGMQLMADSGLTMPQIIALHALRWMGPMSIGGLGEHIRLSVSATSHLVERLVEKSMVERTEDPDDRRQKRVAIAPGGVEFTDRMHAARQEEFLQAVKTFDPEFRGQLANILEAAVQQLHIPGVPGCRVPDQEPK